MNLTEAEIQLLASLHATGLGGGPSDRAALEAHGANYAEYLENWVDAYASLAERGLIGGDDSAYRLLEAGKTLARDYFAERPDRYFYYYREFYRRAYDSAVFSKFCRQAFGLDLTQEGQMDMDGVKDLIRRLELQPGQHLLDLGCGAGGIAEYISDQTGALVTGVDYSPVAVEVGNLRTDGKRDRIDFVQADLNRLELPSKSSDAAVMIDSIYWVADPAETIRRILECLRPGGQLIIVIVHLLEYCDQPGELEIDSNFVARALDQLMLNYSAYDTTPGFLPFWPRVKAALDELGEEFIAEGNEFIYNSLMTEATEEYLPAIEAGDIRRYLYQVRT